MPTPTAVFASLADVTVAFAPPSATGFDDVGLLAAQRELAEIKRRVDATAAVFAAEIALRSRPELGYDGLAQRLGARTPQQLLARVTGASAREAGALLRAGALIADTPTWLRQVATGLTAGALSVDASDAIRNGLGTPDDHVTAQQLENAAADLLRAAPSITVERLAADARDARAELDATRVTDLERVMRERRYLHITAQADGMTRLSGLLDPESAAIVTAAYDAATSPRRGGPRFTDTVRQAADERLLEDPRSTEQIALDAFVDLIRIGTAADDGTILGARTTTVTLHVTATDLDRRHGIARLEGQTAPISIETAERHLCNSGLVPIHFDTDGHVINLGREQRLFTRHQRRGIAARDGGCIFPHCERPPSCAEAHHITQWQHGGRTDLADGVLLCRHHHLLTHNNGWQVVREHADYFVIPPASIDPSRKPIPAPSKQRLKRELKRENS